VTRRDGAPDYGRILLIRTDRVGDLVLSTPAIASFRRSWPAARIEALVTDYTEPVIRNSPDVDSIVTVRRSATLASASALAASLGKDADLVVALAPRTPDYQLAAATKAKKRIGYVYRRRYLSRLAASFLLTDHCISDADPAGADRHPEQPVVHEVHQVQSLVRLAGGSAITDDLVLNVAAEDRSFAAANIPSGAIAINLSPRWFLPNFGLAATAKLIERLAHVHKDILVTHGSDVPDAAARIRDAVRSPNVAWLCEPPLLQWAAALARCDACVTVDTGATHVASAMGVPVVVVFERMHYRLCSQEWAPWRVPSVLLCKPPAGAPADALIEDILAGAVRLSSGRGARQP
jgi:heptosyltransferase III